MQCTLSMVRNEPRVQASEFYNDYQKRFDMFHMCMASLQVEGRAVGAYSIAPTPQRCFRKRPGRTFEISYAALANSVGEGFNAKRVSLRHRVTLPVSLRMLQLLAWCGSGAYYRCDPRKEPTNEHECALADGRIEKLYSR